MPAKARIAMLEMGQAAPKHQRGEFGIADLVGVGEIVARGRGQSEGGDGPRLEPQPVADIIEAHGMGELHKDHRAEVAERAVTARFEIDARLLGALMNDATRNKLEHLPKNIDVVTCWLGGVSVF